ncbi:MAG: NAD-dependent epimerase/dehydratase family protein [Halobacteriaceae archaeon]
MDVLVIGGTRFVGRHAVEEFLDAGHEVTLFNRGEHDNPFDLPRVEGDRTNDSAVEAAAAERDPDVVVDCVAYHPREVETATRAFADARYVYVSSGAAYAADEIPKREDTTDIYRWPPREMEEASYGERKAGGDRAVFAAAERGVEAMSVRPTVVYGPHDYTERLDYWIARVRDHDRVVVPGDGMNLWHRVYVEDLAAAIRLVAEEGAAGEAYNAGDRQLLTLEETVELLAEIAGTEVEAVPANERELSAGDLSPGEFPLYRPYPHVLDTAKLAALGWESTPVEEALARTVADHRDSGRDGAEHDPGREAEERVLGVLETV